MKRTFAYHYRLDLTDAQYQAFVRWAGCVRKVWNYFLGEVKKAEDRYKAKIKAESEQTQRGSLRGEDSRRGFFK